MTSSREISALSPGKLWRVIPPFLQNPAGDQGGLWSRRLWFWRMQVFAARVNPSPPKTSFPPGAVELQGSCCLARPGHRDNTVSLGVRETPRARFSPASGGQILRGAEHKVWSREMPKKGVGAAERCCVLVLGEGEAELFTAQRRAGGGFPFAECHSPASASLPAAGLLPFIPQPGVWPQGGLPEGLCCCRVARLSPCPRTGTAPAEAGCWVPAPSCHSSVPAPLSGSRSPWRGDSSGTPGENISAKPRLSQPGS